MKHISCKKQSSPAKIVDGKLILTFPQAVRPVLWQMDMAENKSCAFEILDGDQKSTYRLVMKKENNEPQDIATFSDPEIASQALIAVGEAMEKFRGYGTNAGGTKPVSANPGSGMSFLKFMAGLAGVIILILLINTLWALSPRPPSSLTGTQASAEMKKPSNTIGEPVSADDFLRGK